MRLGMRVGPFWVSDGGGGGRRRKGGPLSTLAFLVLVGYLIWWRH